MKIVRPDFIFFSVRSDGSTAAAIVDPHGTQFAEAVPKLRGLDRYFEAHSDSYQRVESIVKIGDKLRVLDLTRADVRAAVTAAQDAKALFESNLANDY